MAKDSILLIEDDPDIVELLQYNLEREGYRVVACKDGEEGLQAARKRVPDLILLDLMLPGMGGLEVCRELKTDRATNRIPVIMVTARGEESDVVVGLELGADDYVCKPFSPRELLARVRAVLRRGDAETRNGAASRMVNGEIQLDVERHEVTVCGEPVVLTRAEFRLLRTLLARPGRVFSRGDLADEITAGESIILDRNVDVHVSSLRKKLGDQADVIRTVRGVGYKARD